MDYQECVWKDKTVQVYSIISKNMVIHADLHALFDRVGRVVRTAKNGMLLVAFHHKNRRGSASVITRSIPASCLIEVK